MALRKASIAWCLGKLARHASAVVLLGPLPEKGIASRFVALKLDT
jgi:hypothetical protein